MARKGERLPKAQREMLSRLAIERHRKAEAGRQGSPSHKRCNKCGDWKSLELFYEFKRKLASGKTASYPQSRCKECDIAIRKRNWARLKDEGVDTAALKRRYEANEDPERRRQRWRENQAILRRKAGRAIQSKDGSLPQKGHRFSPGPLVDLLNKELSAAGGSGGPGLLAEQSGVDQRRIYGLLHGEYEQVSLSVVDRLLHGLGLPHMLPILYPEA